MFFCMFVCFAFVWYSYRVQRHNLVTIGKQWIMCVCFVFFVSLRYFSFKCKCLFSFVSLFSFLLRTSVCVCLYNFAFSHLFYNWGAAARTKQYKEKIIFIVKTIHCMWVCVCLFVCVCKCMCVALQNKRDFLFRLSSALLQLLIIHSSFTFSFSWCKEGNSKLSQARAIHRDFPSW